MVAEWNCQAWTRELEDVDHMPYDSWPLLWVDYVLLYYIICNVSVEVESVENYKIILKISYHNNQDRMTKQVC